MAEIGLIGRASPGRLYALGGKTLPAKHPRASPSVSTIDIFLYFYNNIIMEMNEAREAFAALAQEARLDALRTLVRAGPAGLAAGALSDRLGVPPPTLSFHLKELTNAGLTRPRREGRHVFYVADYGGIRRLIEFLLADCCQGDPRLCGPYIIKDERP